MKTLHWDEALAKAKAENKLVFMDCYTSWCGPCKWMATEIFPQKEAGDYFNPKFISVKYDMEKGEGLKLKDKYKPSGYPTFFIIRPDGVSSTRCAEAGIWRLRLPVWRLA